jgi:uncharacterized protein (DUF952 family)
MDCCSNPRRAVVSRPAHIVSLPAARYRPADTELRHLRERMTPLLHITDPATWQQAAAAGEYAMSTRGLTLAEEGFIHCSLPHQIRRIADLVYPDTADLVILVINAGQLTAAVRYEAAEPGGEQFPHIYGPLSASAVSQTVLVSRDATGQLILPPWLARA